MRNPSGGGQDPDLTGGFARARPRAGPRGAANLGTSSSVPGIGAFGNVSTEIAIGTAAPTENSGETSR